MAQDDLENLNERDDYKYRLAKSEIALLGSDACWCAECDMW